MDTNIRRSELGGVDSPKKRRTICFIGDDCIDIVQITAACSAQVMDALVIDASADRKLYRAVVGETQGKIVEMEHIRYACDEGQYYDAPDRYVFVLLYVGEEIGKELVNLAEHYYLGYGVLVKPERLDQMIQQLGRDVPYTLVCRLSSEDAHIYLPDSIQAWFDRLNPSMGIYYVPTDARNTSACLQLLYQDYHLVVISKEMSELVTDICLRVACTYGVSCMIGHVCKPNVCMGGCYAGECEKDQGS